MYDVITIGAATRDVFLVSSKFIALKSRRFPTGAGECVALGSKIDIEELVLTTGGGATNAAATFASLGFRTATLCRIGDDSPGKDVVEDLARCGVSTHLVRMIKNGETAYSTLLTMKDGERTALVHRGTSSAFTQTDVPISIFEQTRWIYLTSWRQSPVGKTHSHERTKERRKGRVESWSCGAEGRTREYQNAFADGIGAHHESRGGRDPHKQKEEPLNNLRAPARRRNCSTHY